MKKYKVLIDSTIFTVFIIEENTTSIFCAGKIDLLDITLNSILENGLVDSNDKVSIEFEKK